MGEIAGGSAVVVPLVSEEEMVCRLCYKAGIPITVDGKYPDDIDPTTLTLRESQISQQDLTKRGFSVQRLSLYSRQLAMDEPERRERDRKQRGKPRAGFALQGVLLGHVAEIHAVRGAAGEQVFRVYETPNSDSVAHAEIKLAPGVSGSQYLKWRKLLSDRLGTRQPISVLPSVPRNLRERIVHLLRLWFPALR